MSAGKSGQQTQAENITGQRGASQVAAQNQQAGLTNAAQGTLNQFEGPVQQSPFYKNLLNSGIESTSQAYDNARSNLMARGNMAGFGYQQPLVQGAAGQLGQQEATAMSQLPREAALSAAGPALSAAGQSGQMGAQYGNQALGWGGQQLSANQQAAGLQQQRNMQNQGLWAALAQIPAAFAGGG